LDKALSSRLRNPTYDLQLDFLIEELDFGIEVQGIHHHVNVFRGNTDHFERRQANDLRKAEICRVCNVALFQVNSLQNAKDAIERIIHERNLPEFCVGAGVSGYVHSWYFLSADPWRWRSWKRIDPTSERLICEKVERAISSVQSQIDARSDYLPYCIEHCRHLVGSWDHWWFPRLRQFYPMLYKRLQQGIKDGEERLCGRRCKWTDVKPGDRINIWDALVRNIKVVSIEIIEKRRKIGRIGETVLDQIIVVDDTGKQFEFDVWMRVGKTISS